MAFRFLLLILFPIFCCLPCWSYAQRARLDVISSDQGLSQGMIYDILQDRTGFLWFATRDGLNRYDGYGFKVYKNDPFNRFSISDNVIKILFEDHLGRIWVGTETNGADILDPSTGKFFHLSQGANGLPNQNVNAIAETADGVMWIGTQNGLSRVVMPATLPVDQPDLSKVVVSQHFFWEKNAQTLLSANVFKSLLVTSDDKLWIGTGQKIYRFDLKTGRIEPMPLDEKEIPSNEQLSNHLSKGPDGSVWIGQLNQITRYKDGRITIIPLPKSSAGHFTSLSFDLEGNLYVSRRKEIFLFLNSDLLRFEQGLTGGVPPPAQVFCSFPMKDVIGSSEILCDRRGLIWIGTNGYGLRRYNPVNRYFQHFLPGVSTRKIRIDAKGRTWVWTSPGYFVLLDEVKNEVSRPLMGEMMWFHQDCLFARDGSVWLLAQHRGGSDRNSILVREDPKTGKRQQFLDLIQGGMYSQLMEDHVGNIWLLGFNSDLLRFDPKSNTSQAFDLSLFTGFREYGFALHEDVNGDIWVGTPHGLVRGIPNQADGTVTFSIVKNDPNDVNSLNNNAILSVLDDARDPGRFLWVGTRGGGLNLLNKETSACKHYTPADGLPNDVIYGILPDKTGYLWLSTNSGLSKFDPNNIHFENYSVADGLQDNEFNTVSYARKPNGHLIFGGVNGLTIFDPSLINPVSVTPPVLITALRIQNQIAYPGNGILSQMIEFTKSITLQYNQNNFTLEFAALDFSTPNKNQFRYRLLGADDAWSEANTNHSTTFSNLPPGNYTFEVITGGPHGVWTNQPTQLAITILAPWWRSTLAYFCYFLIFAALCWQAYWFQVRRIQLQEQLAFEHREAERIRAVEQMKTNFFNNITHELRTPVTLILEPLRQILDNPVAENWLYKVQLAANNSRKLQQLVNQLLDLAKLEAGAMRPVYHSGQVADLLESVAESYVEKARNLGVKFHYGPLNEQVEPFNFDADKLGKIASNLLSNAFKFTQAGDSVQMVWHEEDNEGFFLEVIDTGQGIAVEDLPRVFDRFFSKVSSQEHASSSSGIGLALCRDLAEVMGGRLTVDSKWGEGAAFKLWLPILHTTDTINPVVSEMTPSLSMDLDVDAGLIPAENLPENTRKDNTTRPLLLLAEDNEALRHFIAQTLSPQYDVLEAVDGQAAVEMAFERIPDIIVTDLMMPQLDGFGLLEKLKNDVRTSHIPILMLTAKTAVQHRVEGLQHGADAYLGKPFQTALLLAWLDNLLTSRRRLQRKYVRLQEPQPPVATSDMEAKNQDVALGVLDRQFLERFQEILTLEIDNDAITPEELARRMNMSRSQLHRKLTAVTGLSATEFLRNFRLDRAYELLQQGAGNVSEVAFLVGFVNAKHFSTSFKERFGKSPSEV